MKIPKITIILIAFLAVSSYLPAQTQDKQPLPSSLSLKQAQEYALKNNTSVKNAGIDVELAKKKIWETTAIGLPQINATANYQHLFKVPEMSLGGTTFLDTKLPAGTMLTAGDILNENVFMGFTPMEPIKLGVKDNTTLDITVSQLVFSGEYIVGLQATRVYYQISDRSQKKTEIDLQESVANTYSLVLVLQQNKKFLSQSLENMQKTLAELQAMNKQGFIENTDVDQIELTTLNLTNGIKAIDRQIEASNYLLKFQIGMPLDNQVTLTDNLETIAETNNLETLSAKKFDVNNNIDYKILSTQEAFGRLNLKREQSTYLPSLAAVYQHSEKVNKPEFDFAPRDVLALSMSIPIFSSGQRNSKVQQRKLELQQITNTKENVGNGLQLEYTNARNDLSTAYEKYLNEKKNIELTERIYQKTLVKLKEGLSSSLDLTNSQNQYITAQVNYFNALYSLITAKNKLSKLTNTL